MTAERFRFGEFVLDCSDRQLRCEGQPIELNSRYFDALGLMVREQGRLITKDRFLDEVWRGVPVTDEALTQCIRTLRRTLADDASRPRFIETVPKHGYRFIAPVDGGGENEPQIVGPRRNWRPALLGAGAATVGGGLAGFAGGLVYGFAAASSPGETGAISTLLVVQCLTIIVALMGGAGVGLGIALAGLRDWRRTALGGALGGLVIGAVVKMLGLDAFHLLFGQAPAGITGGWEGAVIGLATGIGCWFVSRPGQSLRRGSAGAAIAGAIAGSAVVLLGGRLMGGSLDLLAHTFPSSRLSLGGMSGLFGETGFGRISQLITAPLEGALFAASVAAAMRLARDGESSLD